MTGIADLLPRAVPCGNRRDLLKKDRRHVMFSWGEDMRHDPQTGCYRLREILVCARCGRERDRRPPLGGELK